MHKLLGSITIVTLFIITFHLTHKPQPTTIISAHIGKPYKKVTQDSTFPIEAKTVIYPSEPPEPDSTWMSGAVILNFDDPKHGFILPPTKWGAVGYRDGEVITITTSPMLETLPFNQLILLLQHVQEMLKSAGWVPRDEYHTWLDTESELEINALQSLLFEQVVVVTLLVPHKYGMSLNVKCYARCDERDPKTARYLIDVSVGRDLSSP